MLCLTPRRVITGLGYRQLQGGVIQDSQSIISFQFKRSIELWVWLRNVLGWLARPDNASWLTIFHNVDQDFGQALWTDIT